MVPTAHGKESRHVECVYTHGRVTAASLSEQCCLHRFYLHFEFCLALGDRGGTVVNVLRYKSQGRWFDSGWCNWNFSLT